MRGHDGMHGHSFAMATAVPIRSPRRRRDRGFSLLVVFMLMIVMVGIAATVILSTQQDLSVSGQDRESLQAFYAAEYGIAQAKDYLEKQVQTSIPNINNFSPNGWTPVLQVINTAGVQQGCATGPTGLPTPISPRMGWQNYNTVGGTADPFAMMSGNVMWRYCIHNNSDDIAYLDSAGNAAAPCSGAVGDNCDGRDPLHLVTVEAWGAFPVDPATGTPLPGAALKHLAVNIGPPTARTPLALGNCGYSQEGGCGSHTGNGGNVDTTKIDTTQVR